MKMNEVPNSKSYSFRLILFYFPISRIWQVHYLEMLSGDECDDSNSYFGSRYDLNAVYKSLLSGFRFGEQPSSDKDLKQSLLHTTEELRMEDIAEIGQSLVSLRNSQRRENVSMLETDLMDRSNAWSKSMYRFDDGRNGGKSEVNMDDESDTEHREFESSGVFDDSNIQEDEMWITFQRLKEVTSSTLFLQQKLKRMARKCLSKVTDIGTHAVSVGDVHVIKELQLANANLKWRLAQKDSIIDNKNVIIKNLQQRLVSLEKENSKIHSRYYKKSDSAEVAMGQNSILADLKGGVSTESSL
jgi:hypothetical protein